MAEETGGGKGKEVHPGSFVGDSIEEFKKLPTWGKIGIGLVFVVVIYLAIKSRQSQNPSLGAAASGAGVNNGNPPLGQGGAGAGAPINILPQPSPGTPPPPTPPPGTPPPPPPPPPPPNVVNPLIPFGQYNGPSYSNLKPNTFYTYQGVTYRLFTGGGGRLWGNPVGTNQQVLLYGPASSYSNVNTANIVQPGGGNGNTNMPHTGVG